MDNRDWQNFILFFYILQADDLKFRLPNIRYYTTPCKDFLDCGAARALIEDALFLYRLEEGSELDFNGIVNNTLGSPIMVKKVAMIESRLRLALSAIEHLSKLTELQKTALKNHLCNGFKPRKQVIPILPGQDACPTLKSAKSVEEVLVLLQAIKASPKWTPIELVSHEARWKKAPFYTDNQWNSMAVMQIVNKEMQKSRIIIDQMVFDGSANKDGQALFTQLQASMMTETAAYQFMIFLNEDVTEESIAELQSIFRDEGFYVKRKEFLNSEDPICRILGDSKSKKITIESVSELYYRDVNHPFYNQGKPYVDIEVAYAADFSFIPEKLIWSWEFME